MKPMISLGLVLVLLSATGLLLPGSVRLATVEGNRNGQPKPDNGDVDEGRHFTSPTTGMVFIRVKAGVFQMGSPLTEKERDSDEFPRRVTLTRSYLLGKYPVTRGQFAQFLRETGRKSEREQNGSGGWGVDVKAGKLVEAKPQYTWKDPGFPQTDSHPVVNVTWKDAEAFCEWLSKKEGKVYRLPTEAEWEYACRAGTRTRYCCGDEQGSLKGHANVADQALRKVLGKNHPELPCAGHDDGYPFTSPVGRFKPNPWGFHDLHGNVWQWTADKYGGYDLKDTTDPKGLPGDGHRALRGGSFCTRPQACRAAFRCNGTPDGSPGYFAGFRVAGSP